MINMEISYDEARIRVEQYAHRELSKFEIDPMLSILEEGCLENSVCWLFFRNRKINIEAADEKLVAHCAFAINRFGAILHVQDNFGNESALRKQMEQLEKYCPETTPKKFRMIWGAPARSNV